MASSSTDIDNHLSLTIHAWIDHRDSQMMGEKKGKKTAIIVGKLLVPVHQMGEADQDCPGAGVGGVSTAARLAKAGFDVTVFEKNDFTGGRCSLIHHDGYVSVCPCYS